MAVRFVRPFVRLVRPARLSGSVRCIVFVSRSRRPFHLSPPCLFRIPGRLSRHVPPCRFPPRIAPGLSAACRSVLQADLLAGRCLTCLRRHFPGILPACWRTGRGAPCCAVPLPGYSSGFGLLSGVEGWSVAPETEQGMPSASTRAPILISSPSGIFSSPCAGVSRSIV